MNECVNCLSVYMMSRQVYVKIINFYTQRKSINSTTIELKKI